MLDFISAGLARDKNIIIPGITATPYTPQRTVNMIEINKL